MADVDGRSDTPNGADTAGTEVGITALAVDQDGTATVDCSVDDARFEISASGAVTIADGAEFHGRFGPNATVTVTAASSDGSTSQQAFNIFVSRDNDAPTDIIADMESVKESVLDGDSIAGVFGAGGQLVATLTAVDADSDESFSFEHAP